MFADSEYVDENNNRISSVASRAAFCGKMNRPSARARAYLRHLFTDARIAGRMALGVFRTDFLRDLGELGAYYGADWILTYRTIIVGPAVEIPQKLLFLRFHPSSSSWSWKDAAKQQEFFRPTRRSASRDASTTTGATRISSMPPCARRFRWEVEWNWLRVYCSAVGSCFSSG